MQGNRMEFLYIPRPRLEEPFIRMLESDEEPRVLNLHSTIEGKPVGGMGKTCLLRRYIEICEERGIRHTELLDFRYTKNRYASAIIWRITALDPDRERGIFAPYWASRREFETIRQMPQEVPEVTYRDIEEQMDRHFVRGFDQLLTRGKVAIFLDTWEAVTDTRVEEWLRWALLLDRFEKLQNRHNLVLVIAGRLPLGWADGSVQDVQVGPFTLEETKKYAESRGYVDYSPAAEAWPASQIVDNVHRASGGHPVLVAWAFDYGDKGIDIGRIALECGGDVQAFRRRLVEETHPERDPLLAWTACLYRRFDAPILQHITGWPLDECRARIQGLLQEYPSIVRPGEQPDSCEPHDEARDMLIEHAWKGMLDPTGEEWQRIRNVVIAYYEQEIAKPPPSPTELSTHHAYMAERMFYLFDRCTREVACLECLRGSFFNPFLPEFDRAVNAYQVGLARSLLGEAAKFEQFFDEELQNWYDISQAHLLSREGKLDEALALYEQVLSRAGDNEEIIAQVKMGMGRCYYLKASYDAALKFYGESTDLWRKLGQQVKYADVLSYLGMVYRAKGEWAAAKQLYQDSFWEALKVRRPEGQKRAALAANQAAQVALLMGDAATARSSGRQALRIWEELDDRFGQADALTTLGRVEEFSAAYPAAEKLFNKALELYTKGPVPSRFGQARVNTYLSRVHRRQRRLSSATRLLEESTKSFKELNKQQQLAFALDELGCVYRDSGQWDKAAKLFQEAIGIAEKIKDWYRLTVIYEDLCVLGRQRGDPPEQIEKYLRQVEELAGRWGYKLFQGRAEIHRGDIAFESEDYQAAFDHYVRACHYLTEYYTDFYIRFLSQVEDRLYSRPFEEIPAYCDQMMAYWQQHELHKEHPALMDRCSRAKQIAQSFQV